MDNSNEAVMEFPCRYPIKAMGKATDDFDSLIVGIIRKHSPEFNDGSVKTRHSRGRRFVSVTVTIEARSWEQLDNIYMELTANERVLVAL